MPVTINGDGSILGLAVGGLPDGSVDADTLATDSVTTNKIANSQVTSGKLASGAVSVDANTMPVGSIIQVQTSKNTTQANMTSTSYADRGHTIQITPNFSNSKIVLTCYFHFQVYRQHQESSWKVQILKNGSAIKSMDNYHYFEAHPSYQSRVIHKANMPITYIDTAGGTSQITYDFHLAAPHGNSSSNQVATNIWQEDLVTAMEIKV
tara:strand:- start:38 stop:661 length:624 start_codon:yes stop_codon:yes gene_type:complete